MICVIIYDVFYCSFQCDVALGKWQYSLLISSILILVRLILTHPSVSCCRPLELGLRQAKVAVYYNFDSRYSNAEQLSSEAAQRAIL